MARRMGCNAVLGRKEVDPGESYLVGSGRLPYVVPVVIAIIVVAHHAAHAIVFRACSRCGQDHKAADASFFAGQRNHRTLLCSGPHGDLSVLHN
jgi:hypothetical protein